MCSGRGIIIPATPLNSRAVLVSLVGEMRPLEGEGSIVLTVGLLEQALLPLCLTQSGTSFCYLVERKGEEAEFVFTYR